MIRKRRNPLARSFRGAGVAAAVCVLVGMGSAGEADQPKLKDIMNKLQTRYDEVNSLEARFSQISKIVNVEGNFTGKGRVYFQKPGKMRWEYQRPDEQVVVSDGKKIWFYRPKDKQVIESPITQAFSGKTPVNFLMGIGNLKKDFDITLLENPKGEEAGPYRLELIPKDEMPDVKKIILQVSRDDFLVRDIRVYDFFLNLNQITLGGIALNRELSEKLFRFSPPKGVKVIQPHRIPSPARR